MPKRLFEETIHPFRLAVGLRMECRAHIELCPEQASYFSPKLARKPRITVGDKSFWEAVLLEDS